MTFEHPAVFAAFVLFIPFLFYDFLSGFKKPIDKRQKWSVFFFRLFIAFLIVAFAGPRWGTGFEYTEYRRGLDVIFAIDVSRSMDLEDAYASPLQTRIERGLYIAKEGIFSIPGARTGAALGRGRGYLAVPLTYNNEVVVNFFETLDTYSMTGRSTNLESLVETAADSFLAASSARKVIVLVSDGEPHFGILRNALNRCVNEGIIVTTVAVGSSEGKPVPPQWQNQQSGAISSKNTAVMRMAAERTGGVFIDGSRHDAANILSSYLLSLANEQKTGSGKTEPKQRRALFILLSIFSYGAFLLIPRIIMKSRISALPVMSIIAFLLIFSSCSESKILLLEANYLFSKGRYDEAVISYQKALKHTEAAPYAEYGLGLMLYLTDESTSALGHYHNSHKILEKFSHNEHVELRYRNIYNSGIIYFEDGNYYLAADAFKEALRINPDRIDAKRNLEISLLSINLLPDANKENRTSANEEAKEYLFDYVKQHEQKKWQSREWAVEENFTGPDY